MLRTGTSCLGQSYSIFWLQTDRLTIRLTYAGKWFYKRRPARFILLVLPRFVDHTVSPGTKKVTPASTFGLKQRLSIMEESSLEKLMDIRKERKPCCTLCRNHGVRTNSKGHKHHCPFSNCNCQPCVKGRQRRVVMRKQVRLRRKQMKDIEGCSNCVTPVEPGRGKKREI